MSRGIKKRLKSANIKVELEIKGNSRGGYSSALAGEGYAGGYRDCLSAVMLLLNGGEPSDNGRNYWDT